jgi:hypothetical protein
MITKPSSGSGAGRLELPVLCRFLRCKSGHGAVEDDVAWQEGTSTTEAYWCLATMEAFGPDDGYAHATVCNGLAARGCYRRRET